MLGLVFTFRIDEAGRALRGEYHRLRPSLRLLIPWTLVRMLTTFLAYGYFVAVSAGTPLAPWTPWIVLILGAIAVCAPVVAWVVKERELRRVALARKERARAQRLRKTNAAKRLATKVSRSAVIAE